tara:strand:- start:393 stop:611 length:219 start_codon:yes stop_codon:yes gene_type:complete
MNIMSRKTHAEFGKDEAEQRLTCFSSGYVYRSMLGEPHERIQTGTAFGNLPDDWSCPECGVHKGNFARTGPS